MFNEIAELNEVLANIQAKAYAEGFAEGLAQGRVEWLAQSNSAFVAWIRRLSERGVLTRDSVRTHLQDLIDRGSISRELGQEALSQLP